MKISPAMDLGFAWERASIVAGCLASAGRFKIRGAGAHEKCDRAETNLSCVNVHV
jgi:hypothetical protein